MSDSINAEYKQLYFIYTRCSLRAKK